MCSPLVCVGRSLRAVLLAMLVMLVSRSGLAGESDGEKLVLGIFPYMSGLRIVKLYQPFADYFGRKLNKNIVIVSAPSFRDFVARSDALQYDVVFTAPHFALRAENRNEYERMYRFENELKGVVFVSAKSQFESVLDLAGKKIAFPDKLAIVSALGEVYFRHQGISALFANMPSHNNVILAVLNDQYDAGVAARPVFETYNKANPGKLKLMSETESIPGAMFMLKAGLADDLKLQILRAFADFEDSAEGKEFFSRAPFSGLKQVPESEMQLMKSYLEVVKDHL